MKLINICIIDDINNTQVDFIHVSFELDNNENYIATFGTVHAINERLQYYISSGECSNGLYFWCSNLIIIKELSKENFVKCIKDLIENGEYKYICLKIDNQETEDG